MSAEEYNSICVVSDASTDTVELLREDQKAEGAQSMVARHVRALCCSLESDMSSITIAVLQPLYVSIICSSIVLK